MRTDGQAGAILLAGGKGSRLFELTARTCKPAVPLGADTLIVDWTLSNLRRSPDLRHHRRHPIHARAASRHISRPQSATCLQPQAQGRQWRQHDRAADGLPWNGDAVRHVLGQDTGREDDPLLIVAADHGLRDGLPPDDRCPPEQRPPASPWPAPSSRPRKPGVAGLSLPMRRGRGVEAFVEKPGPPPQKRQISRSRCLVSMGIYVCDRAWLRAALARGGDDFGYDILPRRRARGEAYAYRAVTSDGAQIYWRDVGTLDVLYRAAAVDLALNPWRCPQPMHALGRPASAEVRHLARRGSVVLPGATVEPGADLPQRDRRARSACALSLSRSGTARTRIVAGSASRPVERRL